MERQYYFDEDFVGAEYRAVIDLVGEGDSIPFDVCLASRWLSR